MGSVEKRFRRLVDSNARPQAASLADLINLAAIIDDELAKLGAPQDARKLVEDYGHTERRE